MAVAALLARPRTALALWIAAIVAVGLAIGEHAPVNEAIRRLLPPLAYLRFPEKHVLLVTGALALVGAFGVERLLATDGRVARSGRAVLLIAASALAALAGLSAPPARVSLLHGSVAVGAFAGALVIARRHRLGPWALPLCLAVDLVSFAAAQIGWRQSSLLERPPPPIAAALRSSGGGVAQDRPPPRLFSPPPLAQHLEAVPENVGLLFGFGHVPGHETASLRSVAALWNAVREDPVRGGALFDVSWMIRPMGGRAPAGAAVARIDHGELVRGTGRGRLHLVGQVRVLDDRLATHLVATSPSFPSSEAVLAPERGARALATSPVGSCSFTGYRPERLTVACETTEEALLVLAEAHAPGWTATVDGTAVSVLRANVAMRGVFLGPGRHIVEMTYRTPGLAGGLAASLVGVVLCLSLVAGARRRSRLKTISLDLAKARRPDRAERDRNTA
jgi:hypothetical protein